MEMENAIAEDLKIYVGCGASMSIGSDCYPYYVSEVLPRGVIGMYRPQWHFDNSWTDGNGKVDAFDQTHQSEFYIKRRYGRWWKVEKSGKGIEPFTGRWSRLSFKGARAYQDPHF